VDSRDLGTTRLTVNEMRGLLMTISDCYLSVVEGLTEQVPTRVLGGKNGDESPAQSLKKGIQRHLLTALLLTVRGISQSMPPLVNNTSNIDPYPSLINDTSIRLKIFKIAVKVLDNEGEADIENVDSLFLISLRIMKCCLPTHIGGLSVTQNEAWQRVSSGSSYLPLLLIGNLSIIIE
jgi:hypothetical protein